MAWRITIASAWILCLFFALHTSQEPAVLGRYSWGYFWSLAAAVTIALILSTAHLTGLRAIMRRYRGPTFLIAASLTVATGVAEISIRLLDPLGISYYEEFRRYKAHQLADEVLIYRHRPSFSSDYQGVKMRFNEHGLRDDPVPPKTNDEYRILFLGDSVVLGWGVDEAQVVSQRLEEILQTETSRPVRAINAGVASYNTVQQQRFLETKGLSFDPDVVLLMYVGNDVWVQDEPFDPLAGQRIRGRSLTESGQLLLGRSWTFRLLSHMVSTTAPGGGVQQGALGWQASMAALQRIRALCDASGIPLVVLYFRYDPRWENTLFVDVRQAVAPTPVHDVGQWFADKDARRYANSIVDGHPNGEGHGLMAAEIAPLLRSLASGDGF